MTVPQLDLSITISLRGFGANSSSPEGPGWYLSLHGNEGYEQIALVKVDPSLAAKIAVAIDSDLRTNLAATNVSRANAAALARLDEDIARADAAAQRAAGLRAVRSEFTGEETSAPEADAPKATSPASPGKRPAAKRPAPTTDPATGLPVGMARGRS